MDDIMRDASADTGGQPVAERSRAGFDADSRISTEAMDAGADVEAGARSVHELAALLRSRGANDMTDIVEGDAPVDGEPRKDAEPVVAPAAQESAVPVDAEQQAEDVVEEPAADAISKDAAAAAIAAEEDTLEIDEESVGDAEDGLPPVPELAGSEAIGRIVYVLLLSQRDGLSLFRLAQACNVTQKAVEASLPLLQQWLDQVQLPVEVVRTGESVKLLSRPDVFPFLQRLRGVKKMEKLSPAALETLAVIAYRQPVMRGEIEAIRGVKAGPMLRTLLQHKLVRVTGRADVPGRPLQYGTTEQFLERFGLSSLQELPSVKEWKQIS